MPTERNHPKACLIRYIFGHSFSDPGGGSGWSWSWVPKGDEFFWLVEQTASSAQNEMAPRRLGHLVERLEDGFADQVDPGAHLVRPAAYGLGYTPKQGRYLALIYLYQKLHRRPPAEADLQAYFRVSPPTVHEMVLTLQRRKFITRASGEARSIRLLLRPEQIPALE